MEKGKRRNGRAKRRGRHIHYFHFVLFKFFLTFALRPQIKPIYEGSLINITQRRKFGKDDNRRRKRLSFFFWNLAFQILNHFQCIVDIE